MSEYVSPLRRRMIEDMTARNLSALRHPTSTTSRSLVNISVDPRIVSALMIIGHTFSSSVPRVCGTDAAFRCRNGVSIAMVNDFGAEPSRPASSLCTLPPVSRPTRGNTRYWSAC
jgi:hypothetical protein